MMAKGFMLMLVGMGVVLLFLSVMVLVMHAAAAFFRKYAHLFPEEPAPEGHLKKLAGDETVDVAIALAAIRKFTE
jgi:sodium pump decarboxylase gamma subunit